MRKIKLMMFGGSFDSERIRYVNLRLLLNFTLYQEALIAKTVLFEEKEEK